MIVPDGLFKGSAGAASNSFAAKSVYWRCVKGDGVTSGCGWVMLAAWLVEGV